ncbi:hypothetical protein Bca52824_040791 [Brassica carinata]|uniref:Uncharacterized protein n=1 Tax=Brassica carinata TaxID=52824 RepID=A0A8X7UX53_BRACI|nr:hypothetical protein Bca52824_040791 [Brassica carinata]
MEGLFSVQSAGQRLISPSLYQCIGSVSIRRSVSGFSMDTRISSRSPSQFTIRSQQESLGIASSSVENDVRIQEWEVHMYQNELAISQSIRIRRKPPSIDSYFLFFFCNLKKNCRFVKIAQAYERGGTAFLSVLTDQKYFKVPLVVIAYCCYIDCLEITFLLKFSNKLGLAALVEVLVGESIVKQNDPEKGIAGLFGMNISHT